MTSHPSRRGALRLGLGVGAAALGLSPTSAARAAEGQIIRGSFASRYRNGQDTPWEVVYPDGYGRGDHLPVLITLHGTGGDATTPEWLRFAEHSRTLAAEGRRAFACVGVTGGDTWWHQRADGTDSASMIIQELGPLLDSLGLDLDRPALYGLSMGAYGGVLMASEHHQRLSSLTLSSLPIPASWDRYSGSFDSPADFAAHDIRDRWARLAGLPIRVDIGDQDEFLQDNLAAVSLADPRPEFYVSPGDHSYSFWSRVALEQFRFVADHL